MQLPSDFIALMREQLGVEQAEALFEGLRQEPTVAVRFNPLKTAALTLNREALGDPVPWCPDAYYLDGRRAFTFDPLFHAGAYYVQDASSMYLAQILRKHLPLKGVRGVLDLCAAPGGKSTLLASLLPEDATLISNEPIRKRAQVLAENMQKWGRPNCFVTQNYPDEFGAFCDSFDLILADVPCSGEGMFRKDPVAISEWSLDNVHQCVARQRDILRSIVPCLRSDGLLVYSTCTFNRYEDEAYRCSAYSHDMSQVAEHIGNSLPGYRHNFGMHRMRIGVLRLHRLKRSGTHMQRQFRDTEASAPQIRQHLFRETFLVCGSVGVLCSLSFGPLSGVTVVGKTIFDLMDWFASNVLLLLMAFIVVLFVGFVMKKEDVRDEITNGGRKTLNAKLFGVIYFLIKWVAPICVLSIFITNFIL